MVGGPTGYPVERGKGKGGTQLSEKKGSDTYLGGGTPPLAPPPVARVSRLTPSRVDRRLCCCLPPRPAPSCRTPLAAAAATANRSPPPAVACRRHTSSFVARRPSPFVVVRFHLLSSAAARRRPSPPVGASRRSSPIVAHCRPPSSMSICRHSNLRKPSLHSLRRVVRCELVPQAHGTAAHGGRDPPPDGLTSSLFVAVSASACIPSLDSCVRHLSAHAGAVRSTAVTCGRRSSHRGLGWIVVASPPSSAKKNWSLAPLWRRRKDVQTPVFLRLD